MDYSEKFTVTILCTLASEIELGKSTFTAGISCFTPLENPRLRVLIQHVGGVELRRLRFPPSHCKPCSQLLNCLLPNPSPFLPTTPQSVCPGY